jgi:hypothetical protein
MNNYGKWTALTYRLHVGNFAGTCLVPTTYIYKFMNMKVC